MLHNETLREFFAHRFQQFAELPAITCLNHTISYRELDSLSSAFAIYLSVHLHIKAGDRIAIQLPNVLQYPVVIVAAVKAGIVIVNTNPLYTEKELLHQLNDADVKAVIVLSSLAGNLSKIIDKTTVEHVIVTQVADLLPTGRRLLINTALNIKQWFSGHAGFVHKTSFLSALAQGQGQELPTIAPARDSLAVLQYTGGTTGLSKGAMLSHGNLLSNLSQVSASLENVVVEGKEIIVAPLPLYHIFSFMVCFLFAFNSGARLILIPDPRNTKQLVSALKGVPFTFFLGLNTLFNNLSRSTAFRKLDFSCFRITVSGGMALLKSTADTWQEITQSTIIEGYGLTEASPVVAINPNKAPRLGTVGTLLNDTQCRMIDAEGNEVASGEPGELLIKGPQVMLGYWRQPEATLATVDKNGWLHTGDIVVQHSDGYLSIVDRIKDMIVVSGFNVYPNNVEGVISKHPDVVECAVIGVDDPDTIEAIKVFVVSSNPALTAEGIQAFARHSLSGYKVPRHVEFVTDLPKSNVGKILRRELRDNN